MKTLEQTTSASLQRLEAVDIVKLAFSNSGKTMQQIAEEMGWSMAHARRVCSTARYYPSLEDMPKLCAVLGNTYLPQWIQIRAMMQGMQNAHASVDCQSLVLRIGDFFGEVADVGKQGQAAIEDGVLEAAEMRSIIRELYDVIDMASALIGDLREEERRLAAEERAKDSNENESAK